MGKLDTLDESVPSMPTEPEKLATLVSLALDCLRTSRRIPLMLRSASLLILTTVRWVRCQP